MVSALEHLVTGSCDSLASCFFLHIYKSSWQPLELEATLTLTIPLSPCASPSGFMTEMKAEAGFTWGTCLV